MNAATRTAFPVPAGMVQVTKEKFFAALYADRRDIMPTHENDSFTNWNVVHGGQAWGRSFPGWKNPGDAEAHFIIESAAR